MEKRQVIRKAKAFSVRVLIVSVIFLLSLVLFIVIANEMVLEKENNLDIFAFDKLAAITNPSMTKFMEFITFFGSNYFLLPAYLLLIAYFLLFKGDARSSLDVGAIGITSTIVLFSLKAIFHRQRPMNPLVTNINGFSFPSGHSFCSFTFFGMLIYILWKHEKHPLLRWTGSIFFSLFATTVAFSRVYLHVHYASDVVAGFCMCIVWLGLSFWVINRFRNKLS
jgi:undecaprenyl-diphosphatase